GWPLLAVALAVTLGFPAGIVAAAYGVAIGAIAWHSSVRTSLHPLVESGTRVPIPPELAPKEVLDAADIDDRGRPRCSAVPTPGSSSRPWSPAVWLPGSGGPSPPCRAATASSAGPS